MNYHDPNLNSHPELRATEHRNLANNPNVLRRSPIRSMLIKWVIFAVIMGAVLLWIGTLSAPEYSSDQTGGQDQSNP